ncbi:MAG: acyl-CoA synthetase [Sneathiellaceae bacterium]
MAEEQQSMHNPFETDLDKNPANYVPLTPLSFLSRTAYVHPGHTAWIHGDRRADYRAFQQRSQALASALSARGVGTGSTVAVMASNIPAHLEAHFGIAMAGGVLNSINTRLDPAAVAFILDHGEARVVMVDRELAPVMRKALAECSVKPLVIDIDDPAAGDADTIGALEYEDLLKDGDPDFAWSMPADEWQAIALNYTSGTTGNPKGVVYHHRGAYMNAIGNAMAWGMGHHPVYLWTLPMFHCNGWCFPWTITAYGGTHVCLRKVEPVAIYDSIATNGVTHFCGAPTVLNMMINAPEESRAKVPPGVKVMTAGAAPPAAIIQTMEGMGMAITHTYGLTETYGPSVVCSWHAEWDDRDISDRAALKARQGVRYPVLEGLQVMDPETMQPVPQDGETMGEIMFRGNVVMKGYLKNPSTTEKSLAQGWFHSGDLAVVYPDGYVQIKDRSKDIIISGGENISTLEVEGVLYQHPAIMEAAVVAKPDPHWGETPCAFVTLKPGAKVTAEEIIEFARARLAKFKCPRHVVFAELPKTSTGKIQKFVLREQAQAV